MITEQWSWNEGSTTVTRASDGLPVAKFFNERDAQRAVASVNNHDELVKRIEQLERDKRMRGVE